VSTVVTYTVFAIATFFIGKNGGNVMASNLAETYYEKALSNLPKVLPLKNLQTLQSILLMLLFTLVNPQAHHVALARLCAQSGDITAAS
jgi:choline-glycine betaine transporter